LSTDTFLLHLPALPQYSAFLSVNSRLGDIETIQRMSRIFSKRDLTCHKNKPVLSNGSTKPKDLDLFNAKMAPTYSCISVRF
jgi:hypothetical protein